MATITPLPDIQPFSITGEGLTEVAVSRSGVKIFSTRLSAPYSFDPRDIIGADMIRNSSPVGWYKITVGEQETSFYILHDLADVLNQNTSLRPQKESASGLRFLMERDTYIVAPGWDFPYTVLSEHPFRIRFAAQLPDGTTQEYDPEEVAPHAPHISCIRASREYRPVITRGIVTISIEPLEADTSADPGAVQRIRLFVTDRIPQAMLFYTNRYLVTECLQIFGNWEMKASATAETAAIGGTPVPYDISRERELTVTTHPVDALQAADLASVASMDGKVTAILFSGRGESMVQAALTKSEIEIAPGASGLSQLKLTMRVPSPGYRSLSPHSSHSLFTPEFTKIFT